MRRRKGWRGSTWPATSPRVSIPIRALPSDVGGAGGLALPAQPAAARHRLGLDGALARSAHAAGDRRVAAPDRAAAAGQRRGVQAVLRRQPRPSPPRLAARPNQDRILRAAERVDGASARWHHDTDAKLGAQGGGGIRAAMRFLLLCTDAYGGHGGIALFNRQLVGALAEHPQCEQVVVVPRLIVQEQEPLPPNVLFDTAAARGKLAWMNAVRRRAREHFDV